MIPFAVISADGAVLSVGRCERRDLRLQARDGGRLVLGKFDLDDIVDPDTRSPVGKVKRPDHVDPPQSFIDARRQAYPSVGEQLDMLWHAMDQGLAPKSEPFYGRILAVKQAYPKDGSMPAGSVIIYGD